MTLAETLKSDIDFFLRSDEFAIAFTYQLKTGGALVNGKGLFDHASTQVDDIGAVSVQINEATLTCSEAQLPNGFGEGDQVSVGGKSYKVCAPPLSDGQGVVALHLELV